MRFVVLLLPVTSLAGELAHHTRTVVEIRSRLSDGYRSSMYCTARECTLQAENPVTTQLLHTFLLQASHDPFRQ